MTWDMGHLLDFQSYLGLYILMTHLCMDNMGLRLTDKSILTLYHRKLYLVVLDLDLDTILHVTVPPVLNPDPQQKLLLYPRLECAGDDAVVTRGYSQGQSHLKHEKLVLETNSLRSVCFVYLSIIYPGPSFIHNIVRVVDKVWSKYGLLLVLV